MLVLVCTAIKFYCLKDEDAFFDWLNKIACVSHTSAARKELYLHVAAQQISDQDLDDLIGLFYRYKVDMSQLAQFLTNDNKVWFHDNKKAFWYKKVFGVKKPKK